MKKFLGLILKLALADVIAGWMVSLTKMMTKKTRQLLAEYEEQLRGNENDKDEAA